ncbi:murein transglycosylase A [Pseudodesulfovibrio piezophilus]|uniref:peptidoglycan lytic exotransglycosylase n=1 Tax=Pseudodesulfovibrio piezophilus (strain DSM 21447 / JCM 15486 / C1TLV30) TaxID=1322246 RepID=M1WPV3_PSEP2|nr:MltA domain-containing protein [Pseudodesulfovibrio piezophilus]CCH47307.1 MltA domain protein [Pseudodesulfovibrio piezophilus C1TLV30]
MMSGRFFYCLFLLTLASLWGCSAGNIPDSINVSPYYEPLTESQAEEIAGEVSIQSQGFESWMDLQAGLEDSLGYILRRPQQSVCVTRPGLTLTWEQVGDSVAELLALLPHLESHPELLSEHFEWLKVSPRTLLTGYYEPWLEASLTKGGVFQYPLYGVPEDLKTLNLGKFHHRWKGQTLVYRIGEDGVEPYLDREAIDGEGGLEGKGDELAWAKDPVDVFFLQIQGSGRLVLRDGSVKHILYGGKNGHKYVSLGKLLIERGFVPREEMSMQRIRAFLDAHPYVAQKLMFENPSYVFFHLSDVGPYGSIGSILTPRLSAAVDPTMVPLGSVLALKTNLMNYQSGETEPFTALVLAQDTGGAIKGTRMDLFCGSGEEAENLAGHLQEESEVFMLVSKRTLASAIK